MTVHEGGGEKRDSVAAAEELLRTLEDVLETLDPADPERKHYEDWHELLQLKRCQLRRRLQRGRSPGQ